QIEELDGGDEGVDGLRRELALLGEIELVLADGFEVEFGGVAMEILGELGDIMDVASLRSGGEVADAHAARTQSCLRSCVDVVVSCVRLLRVLDWSIATTESSVSRSLAPRYGSRGERWRRAWLPQSGLVHRRHGGRRRLFENLRQRGNNGEFCG